MSSPEFYTNAGDELMTTEQFRRIYDDVFRVAKLAEAEQAMNFGPNIVNLEGALEEGFIGSPGEFKPMLLCSTVKTPVTLEGDSYDEVGIFFKLGGNKSAAQTWLGNLTFQNAQKRLKYEFRSRGSIEATRYTVDSYWREVCLVRKPQADNLENSLELLKQDLHDYSLGSLALSETVSRSPTARERVLSFFRELTDPADDGRPPRVLAGGA